MFYSEDGLFQYCNDLMTLTIAQDLAIFEIFENQKIVIF